MPLSKPFPLQKLPRLAFEHVLHQMYPLDLLEISNIASKPFLNRLKASSLASHCDICDYDGTYAELSITMKSGYALNWCVIKIDESTEFQRKLYREESYLLEGGPSVVVVNDSFRLENYKCTSTDTIYSEAFLTGSEPLEVPLFTQLLSKFPCPIKKLSLQAYTYPCIDKKPIVDEFVTKYIFNLKTLEKCQHLEMVHLNRNVLEHVLGAVKVTKKVAVHFHYQIDAKDWKNFPYYLLKDYKELKLHHSTRRSSGFKLTHFFNREHISLYNSRVPFGDLIEFFKIWQNGKQQQLKTFLYAEDFVDLSLVIKELDVGLSKPKDSPRFVKCAEYYLETTPKARFNSHTILMKNCHGQLATLALTFERFSPSKLYFAVWEEPYTEVKIPSGYRMKFLPFCMKRQKNVCQLRPQFGEVFEKIKDIKRDRKGFPSPRQANWFSLHL